VHSNDVNPYSCALGWYFSVQPWTTTRWLDFVDRDMPYHRRMVAAYRDQFPRMHADTVQKLEAVTLRLASFYPGDVRDYLRETPTDAPCVIFPPFWAGGYETMFRGIETHFAL
jgi:hypothetical protein